MVSAPDDLFGDGVAAAGNAIGTRWIANSTLSR
jgi:hypothetical protein